MPIPESLRQVCRLISELSLYRANRIWMFPPVLLYLTAFPIRWYSMSSYTGHSVRYPTFFMFGLLLCTISKVSCLSHKVSSKHLSTLCTIFSTWFKFLGIKSTMQSSPIERYRWCSDADMNSKDFADCQIDSYAIWFSILPYSRSYKAKSCCKQCLWLFLKSLFLLCNFFALTAENFWDTWRMYYSWFKRRWESS